MGFGLAYNHPLWEEQDYESAKVVLSKIKNISKLTQKEQDYIQAIRLLYGKGEKLVRDKSYSKAMKDIYRNYPNDLEAACFYSLSLLAVARNTVNKLRLQVEAGSIALEVFQKNPDHPCAAHYAIHAFDHPDLARLALPSAKRYAKISPHRTMLNICLPIFLFNLVCGPMPLTLIQMGGKLRLIGSKRKIYP